MLDHRDRESILSIETEIARRLHEEAQDRGPAKEAVRLPVDMDHMQRLWPAATQEEILRAYLIAYELLVLDAAEARAARHPAVMPVAMRDGRKHD